MFGGAFDIDQLRCGLRSRRLDRPRRRLAGNDQQCTRCPVRNDRQPLHRVRRHRQLLLALWRRRRGQDFIAAQPEHACDDQQPNLHHLADAAARATSIRVQAGGSAKASSSTINDSMVITSFAANDQTSAATTTTACASTIRKRKLVRYQRRFEPELASSTPARKPIVTRPNRPSPTVKATLQRPSPTTRQ